MFEIKEKYDINDLREIMKELRSEHGCPWDKVQTHESIRRDVLEEAHEVADAIDSGDKELLKEELGDLLLQVVFHSEIESEHGSFSFDDVCDGICKKLVYRHPHVFGDLMLTTPEEVLATWDSRKAKAKKEQTVSERLRDLMPSGLPALMKAEKVGERAAHAGMDFRSSDDLINRLNSEVKELENAVNEGSDIKIEEELGDILFSCTNLARFFKKDSEKALTIALNKFIIRFSGVEKLLTERGKSLSDASDDELADLWETVKKSSR